MFKSLHKQVSNQLQRVKADHYTVTCKDMSRKAKPTWDHLNSAPGRNSHKPINSINCNNKTLTRAEGIVNTFAEHLWFCTIARSTQLQNPHNHLPNSCQILSNFRANGCEKVTISQCKESNWFRRNLGKAI